MIGGTMLTSRGQDEVADRIALRFGRAKVMPLDRASACVLIVGLRDDDSEAVYVVVPPSGAGARAATATEIWRAEQRERSIDVGRRLAA